MWLAWPGPKRPLSLAYLVCLSEDFVSRGCAPRLACHKSTRSMLRMLETVRVLLEQKAISASPSALR